MDVSSLFSAYGAALGVGLLIGGLVAVFNSWGA